MRDAVLLVLREERAALLTFLRARVPPHVDVDDVLQAGALRAVERAESLRDPKLARQWVRRVLSRVASDAARAPVREQVSGTLDDQLAVEHEGSVACPCPIALVRELPPVYRLALERVTLEGASLDTFAREASISKGNAAVRLLRARRALRRRLLEHCGVRSVRDAASCLCSCASQESR